MLASMTNWNQRIFIKDFKHVLDVIEIGGESESVNTLIKESMKLYSWLLSGNAPARIRSGMEKAKISGVQTINGQAYREIIWHEELPLGFLTAVPGQRVYENCRINYKALVDDGGKFHRIEADVTDAWNKVNRRGIQLKKVVVTQVHSNIRVNAGSNVNDFLGEPPVTNIVHRFYPPSSMSKFLINSFPDNK